MHSNIKQLTVGGESSTAMMMAAAKLATTATGDKNKVDDVIDDLNKKKQSIRSEADEQLNMPRKSDVTPKQRWHWAYNKIIMQLNVSTCQFLIHKWIHQENYNQHKSVCKSA